MWDKLALILLVIGGINWGLVGIFELDLVAWMFGGAASLVSRMIYILVQSAAYGYTFRIARIRPVPLCELPKIHCDIRTDCQKLCFHLRF